MKNATLAFALCALAFTCLTPTAVGQESFSDANIERTLDAIRDLKDEIKAVEQRLNNKIDASEQRLKDETKAVEQRLKADIDNLDETVADVKSKVDNITGQISSGKWIITTIIAVIVGIPAVIICIIQYRKYKNNKNLESKESVVGRSSPDPSQAEQEKKQAAQTAFEMVSALREARKKEARAWERMQKIKETWEVSRQDIFQQEGELAEEILQQEEEEMWQAVEAHQKAQETTVERMRAVNAALLSAPEVRTAAMMYFMQTHSDESRLAEKFAERWVNMDAVPQH